MGFAGNFAILGKISYDMNMTKQTPHSSKQPGALLRWFHRFTNPAYFYQFAGKMVLWLIPLAILLILLGLYKGLWLAPEDYQMGDSARIMYVHVPSAWLSMFAYLCMAISALIGLVWHIKLAFYSARAIAPIGTIFTVCALVTGALWGKPTWGTYWQWDARMTSELILLFLYLGYLALYHAIEDRQLAQRASSMLAIIGVINIPIIHYSVEWWHSLHQDASISIISGTSTIHASMLWPLIIMALGFKIFFFAYWLCRLRVEILYNEQHKQWVGKI